MQVRTRKVDVCPQIYVSSLWAVPSDYDPARGTALILAHGAGNDMNSPFLSFVHEAVAARSVLSVKFNFPYKERRAKLPDRTPLDRKSTRLNSSHMSESRMPSSA